MNKTLKYYEENFENLIKRYQKVNLDEIQKYLLKQLKKEDFILELGFGSGREINFLLSVGFKNIYGIDGSKKFVEYIKNKFKSNNFVFSILPEINIKGKFDFIYSIAVIMHLCPNEYKKLIENIDNLLKNNGKFFVSYSLNKRNDSDRDFFDVDEKKLTDFFEKKSIFKIDEFISLDSLNRNIKWKNILYRKKVD